MGLKMHGEGAFYQLLFVASDEDWACLEEGFAGQQLFAVTGADCLEQ